MKLNGGFDPAEVGGEIGLTRSQSETAARELANAGILVLGFDSAAHFSSDYCKAHTKPAPRAPKPPKVCRDSRASQSAKHGKE